jgi:hypothetical protein
LLLRKSFDSHPLSRLLFSKRHASRKNQLNQKLTTAALRPGAQLRCARKIQRTKVKQRPGIPAPVLLPQTEQKQ